MRHRRLGRVIAGIDLRFIFGRLFHAGYRYRHFIHSRLRHVGCVVESDASRLTFGNCHVKLLAAKQCPVYMAFKRERSYRCRPVVDNGCTDFLVARERAARQRQLYSGHRQVGISGTAPLGYCKFINHEAIHVGLRRGVYSKKVIPGFRDFKVDGRNPCLGCLHYIFKLAQHCHLLHVGRCSVKYFKTFGETFQRRIIRDSHMAVAHRQRYRVHHHQVIIERQVHVIIYGSHTTAHVPRNAILVGINHIPLVGVALLVKAARVWQLHRLYGVHLHRHRVVLGHRIAIGLNAHLDSVQPACRQVGLLLERIFKSTAGLDRFIYCFIDGRTAIYRITCHKLLHDTLADILNRCSHRLGIGIIPACRRRYSRNRQVGSPVACKHAIIIRTGFHYSKYILISAHKVHVVA